MVSTIGGDPPRLEGEKDMARHLRRTALRCVAVAAAVALPLLAAAGPASASTGNWGWGGAGQPITPGVHDLTTGFSCRSGAPCLYEPGMTVMVTAFNGATLSAPSTLVEDTNNTTAGTCALEDSTHIVCTFTTSGSAEHAKGAIFSYTLTVPDTGANGATVATQTWADSVQTGNSPGDDVYTFTLAGSEGQTPTTLVARPALRPPSVTVGSLSAQLTTASDPAQPVVGVPVEFSLNGTLLCTGITDSDGVASCTMPVRRWAAVIANGGFTATFHGTAGYLSSTAEGQRIG